MAIQGKQVATELSALKRRFNPELYDFLVRLKEKADKNAKDIQDLLVSAQSGAPVTNAILTTKGDILSHDGSAQGRFPVGTAANGDVITRDSGAPFGMKWAAAAGGGGAPLISEVRLRDDFLGGSGPATETDIGELNWRLESNNRTGGQIALQGQQITDDRNHPGQVLLYATAGGSNSGCLHLSSDSLGATGFDPRLAFELDWVFRLDATSGSDMLFRIGCCDASTTIGTNFGAFHLEFDPTSRADTTYQARWFDETNTEHLVDTGITPDTSWHRLRITHAEDASSLLFYIDDSLVATITSFSYGDYNNVSPGADIWGGVGVYLDLMDLHISGLVRYTPA